MSEGYDILDRRLICEGGIVDFYKDTIKLPNGNVVEWDYVKHKGAVAIVPVMDDGKIIMVRQYRNGADTELLEIPAGGINPGEDPYETGLRELEEETGYKTDKLYHLVDELAAPAYNSECIYIYYAKNLVTSKTNYDENEIITLETYELDELIAMIMDGRIVDSKTIIGLFTYKQAIGR